VEIAARLVWDGLPGHPGLASAMAITRPQALAGGLAASVVLLATLGEVGLGPQPSVPASITLFSLVRGVAMHLELQAGADAPSGVDSEEWLHAQEPRLRAIVDAGNFPVFLRYVSQDYDFSLDELFEFGLSRMVDGLAALLDERPK